MADDEILEVENDEPTDDDADWQRLRAELDARCKAASIKFEEVTVSEGRRFIRIHLPAGRITQPLLLSNTEDIQNLLAIPFEKYVLLGDYAAICSYTEGVIEAGLASAARLPLRMLLQKITGDREDLNLEICNPAGPEKLS